MLSTQFINVIYLFFLVNLMIMKTKNLLVVMFACCASISFAQITREQADEIVFQYIIDEEMRTDVLLLYTTDILPNAEGTSTVTTYISGHYETFSIEYPCWVYHIDEWMDVNCCRPHRYLFVNKDTGNILEVKTKGSPYNPNSENWQLIYSAISGVPNIDSEFGVFYFSNPVSDFLEITCEKDFEYIVIFNLQGKQVLQETFKKHESIQKFNVSSLHKGLYIVNIFDATKNILTFKILKK